MDDWDDAEPEEGGWGLYEPETVSVEADEGPTYRLRGAAARYYECTAKEVLCESGAGTGKTMSLLIKAHLTALEHPGCRQIFLRKTRRSLVLSVLPQWEEQVLGPGHPAIHGTARMAHRDFYEYPAVAGRRSVIYVAGIDNWAKYRSSEWDRIYAFQAEELSVEDWEELLARLRAGQGTGNTPYYQLTGDVNPDVTYHHLNARPEREDIPPEERMVRIRYRHEDNPRWWDGERWTPEGEEYLKTLGMLTGTRRERLLYHRWCSEEGLVWEEYDQEVHLLTARVFRRSGGREYPMEATDLGDIWLDVQGWPEEERLVHIRWTFASVDWGTTKPGCMQAWGVDGQGRIFMLAEHYHTKKTRRWWADRAVELWERYDFRAIVCDPEEPDSIRLFNDRISERFGGPMDPIAKKANNAVKTGIALVSDKLADRELFFLRDALLKRDPELARQHKPTCTVQEVVAYVYPKQEDGKPHKEKPDPACEDHGCDAARYGAMFAWGKDLAPERTVPQYPYGSAGEVLGHAETWKKIRSGDGYDEAG